MANQIYCKHCGKQIDADSAFCMHCGGAIQDHKREVSFIHIVDGLAGKLLVVIIHYTRRLINSLKPFYFLLKRTWERIAKKKITIPNNITVIKPGAYKRCKNITNIVIGNNVAIICNRAFEDCKKLIDIAIPNSVVAIENKVFHGCSSLTNITIPDSVTSIGDEVFSGCNSLTSITIPNSVTSIGNCTFEFGNDIDVDPETPINLLNTVKYLSLVIYIEVG